MNINSPVFKVTALSAILALTVGVHFFSSRTDSLASVQKPVFDQPTAHRSTKLGEAKPSTGKSQKEVDLKLLDPTVAKMWGLKLTASDQAWLKHNAVGSRDIIVAVIDTGIDTKHPDLRNNLWVNVGEAGYDEKGRDKASNGVDDDGNGYVDDVHGWNFASNNSDLKDHHGHGTHISGIIGAEGGNDPNGVVGVAPRVSIMTLKYYDPKASGQNNLQNTVRAIEYAVKMNAHIINYSGGGLEPSALEKAAIKKAEKKGILFVAAAGNEHSNSDINAYYPADYDLDNIISVTAIDEGENILPTSNYGVNSVDIAAPGNNIKSTLPEGRYGTMTGTSQATAFVSGVAALLKAKFGDFDAKRISKHLKETGDLDPKLVGKTRYRKRLNTYRALAILGLGVGVSGAIADNATNIDPQAFASDQSARPQVFSGDNADSVASLSNLMKQIVIKSQEEQKAKTPAVRQASSTAN